MIQVPLIELHNVWLRRGDTPVFSGMDLRVEQDVNTLILGPNGAGKSSLIKLILRDLYPLHREHSYVHILGDAHADVWSLRSKFGIVSHELQHVFEEQATGLQVVASGFYSSLGTWQHQRFSREQLEQVRRTMMELGVAELEQRAFGTLSTGQQRRLLLARALVHRPRYLLLDEPTSGLDPQATFGYLESIGQLIAQGHQLVLVTHHLHEIPPQIDRVIMLKDGAVFAQGAKKDLLNSRILSALYDMPLELVEQRGVYQVFPA